MAVTISMPKLGLTMTEGLVAKWFIKEGDPVKRGDPLFEVETDKLTNLVEADCEGVLLKIVADEGVTVPCTQPVAYVGAAGEALPEALPAAATAQAQMPVQEKPAPTLQTDSAPHAAAQTGGGLILATPAAKELAKQRGIDISQVAATGPNGSIVLKDVEAYRPAAGAKASGLAMKIATELGMDVNALHGEGRVMSVDVLRTALTAGQSNKDTAVPLNGMRKTIARRMSESWNTSPRVCFEMAVDCTNMAALRMQLKKAFEEKGLKLTYNHIIMMASAKALQEYPEVNASLEGEALLLHEDVNIGLAVGMENGLLVPNLKGCGRMGLARIAAGTEDMVRRAREGRSGMDELCGGTFTITNLGMFGMRSFSPIINQPELAILGVNAIVDMPVAINGEVVIRPMMTLNLVADHRVVDGVLAAKFLHRIVEMLETPSLMLL